MYYNTSNLTGDDLKKAHSQTAKQEEIIEILFKAQLEGKFSPSDIWKVFTQELQKSVLLTSVRRSITDLTESGKLVKLPEQKMGIYKRPEYLWQYNTGQQVKEEELPGEPIEIISKKMSAINLKNPLEQIKLFP